LDIIIYEHSHNSAQFGTYHYSNGGEVTWYGFAQEIFKKHNLSPVVNPVTSGYFSTPATRPAYSVMDKSKIKETFKLNIPQWQTLL
ncbi:MAG: sugar nucleotide-binding protein, partial [Flavobacterium sp.]